MTSSKELLNTLKMLYEASETISIIKEKKVDIVIFLRCKDYNDYNKWWAYKERLPLTKKEFKLLKEVFYE